MSEFQNAKIFLLKDMTPNWSVLVPWTYVISDLNGAEIVRSFHEKELQKNLELRK